MQQHHGTLGAGLELEENVPARDLHLEGRQDERSVSFPKFGFF